MKWLVELQVLLEVSEGDPSVHDHGLPRMAWTRAVRLITRYESDKALDLIDERAERPLIAAV